ncbi:hypothetical protein BTVI_159172 [Pitangus sulphuratus]|nr:hypothetical protein BTVI_159172 [Pitangus sulphuratus]
MERAAGYQLRNIGFDAKPLEVENSKSSVTQKAVSPITVTKSVKKKPYLQDTKSDQGRDKASCLSDRGKLRCSALIEHTCQSCQFKSWPKRLNFTKS